TRGKTQTRQSPHSADSSGEVPAPDKSHSPCTPGLSLSLCVCVCVCVSLCLTALYMSLSLSFLLTLPSSLSELYWDMPSKKGLENTHTHTHTHTHTQHLNTWIHTEIHTLQVI